MPPPPPPPLPSGQRSNHAVAPDRGALLCQIHKGTRLKKTHTNDRSGPLLDSGGSKASPFGSSTSSSSTCRTNGPTPMIPPGGLFPHGVPKLRPAAPRTGDNFLNNHSGQTNWTADGSGSRSHPPSPAAHVRQTTGGLHRSLTENNPSGHKNFPSDLNLKGPAPAPPPANTKPMVRRSVSQSNLGPKPRLTRPPPNVRPPPPPKSTAALQSGMAPPPALPSKPPNVTRRQSFNVTDSGNSKVCLTVPPPPPRNNSVPNMMSPQNSSPTSVHVSRMSIAPPPPPPGRPGVSRASSMIRPVAPRSRPPDPPSHPVPPPPSQTKVMAPSSTGVPPPPPTRVSSIANSPQTIEPLSELETRFFYKFRSVHSLPSPEKFMNLPKTYPSKIVQQKSMRRLPPPPPPANNSTNRHHMAQQQQQAVLHIQLGSRVFMNNTAQC